MNSALSKRIAAIEHRLLAEPVVLHFADGSKRSIVGTWAHWCALNEAFNRRSTVVRSGGQPPEDGLSGEMSAIMNSIRITETGDMINLLKVINVGGMPYGSVNS